MSKPAHNRRDIAGMRFGRLTAKSFLRRNKHRRAIWLCQCECGKETEAVIGNLLFGRIKSCGCLGGRKGQSLVSHGMHDWPEYRIWVHMRRRCSVPTEPYYHRYGGRGIRVAAEWLGPEGFPRFIAHIGRRPSGAYSVDRIDNDGNYGPGNVRWATALEQSRNTSRVRLLEHDGRILPLSVWARELGVGFTTLSGYLRRHSLSEAVERYSCR